MHPVDKLVAFFSPLAGLKRRAARSILASYEGAEPSRLRKFHRDSRSPNALVQQSAVPLRAQVRHLERNHDIARGILRTLVNNVVGPKGIGIEPQPRRADGSIHKEYAAALMEAWRDWCRRPDVTHRWSWSACQRMMCRAWLRDGESFAQMLAGPVPLLDHGTRVPLSIEMFEADMVPLDYSDGARIRQGIECNAWGKPVATWVYKTSPNDLFRLPVAQDLKRVPFDNMIHLAVIDRIGQLRGVSEFASVITRLEDIKDYEESERVAAKIAAMLTAYVKKGTPDLYDAEASKGPRQINFAPGMIIDDLGLGEEIGLIDSKRPNPNVITFRQGQLRAAAGGVGASYSSISRDYSGTYSSQRQELVEQYVNYATLTDEFVGQLVQPVWEMFVFAAHASGAVQMPKDLKPGTADDACYVAQAMPWIDPLKEALGAEALIKAGLASTPEMIRRRGANPADVIEQQAAFNNEADERGLTFSTRVAPEVVDQATEEDDAEDDVDREVAAAMRAHIMAALT